MRNSRIFLAFLFFAFAVASCKKDNDDNSGGKSRKELLIGAWRLTGATETPAVNDYDGDGRKDSDVFPHFVDCDKDNIVTFLVNGTYSVDEGPTKCSPSDPQIFESGTWTMSSDEKTLTANGESVQIVEITATTMKLSSEDVEDGPKYTQALTYTRRQQISDCT